MAKIVLGIGVSHGPMLDCEPELWTSSFRVADENNSILWFRKQHLSYNELVELRASEDLESRQTVEETTKRLAACRIAEDEIKRVYDEVNPDVIVIIGNDHREVFTTVTPAFGVYTSDVHHNKDISPPALYKGVYTPECVYGPKEAVTHPGLPEMSEHVTRSLMASGFDISVIEETPTQGNEGEKVSAHAFGFIYHHILADDPPPSLQIHINTFFPPNQPTMERVFEFSEALVDAIESWDSDLTVAIIGSGGLTHFIVDEELDERVIDALSNDIDALKDIDEAYYQSGTSEVKNWAPVAVAMRRQNVPMTLVDYVPCYRSPAGNGHGMTFAYWRP